MNRTRDRLRFLAVTLALLLAVSTLFRVGFLLLFAPVGASIEPSTLAQAFYLGFKYDPRLGLLLLLPFLLLGQFRALDPTRTPWARRFWLGHMTLLAVALAALYLLDLGNYAYLSERIDASALRYLKNPVISMMMVWESYPILWGVVGILAAAFGIRRLLGRLLDRPSPITATSAPLPVDKGPWRRRVLIATVVVVYSAGIYGKFSHYPLRWSDAFFGTDKFVSDLALNPLLFFASSLGTAEKEQAFDLDELSRRYGRVAEYLGVEDLDPERRHFARYIRPLPTGAMGPVQPNVVLIFLESFATHRTGAAGNPLNASPNFDAIAADSLFFPNFYTPRTGTARGVFATLTGIPDTITFRTASRNPRTITQNTVLRAFEGYRKFYFRGGSASWANIRALFIHNHQEFEIYEEGDFQAARVDVWGIPDYRLAEEADRVLSTVEDAPFFAFLHLAGNHRPYTIPDDIPGFSLRNEDDAYLREQGFVSLPEFNSFRLLDFSLGHFLKLARQQPYFDNTIFIILSDNGSSSANAVRPACEEDLRMGVHHAPLAIYAPALIPEGRIIYTPATQMDIMPTAAALAGVAALNTTLGRNLLDPRFADNSVAFMYRTRGTRGEILLYDGDTVTLLDRDGSNLRARSCPGDVPPENPASEQPVQATASTELALGLYHASKYLLYNNSPALYQAKNLEPVRPAATEASIPRLEPLPSTAEASQGTP